MSTGDIGNTVQLQRFNSLDAIRGVAVMGILAMNIVAFSMPMPAYFNPAAYGGHTGVDLAAWFFNFVFVDSKMRGMFSVLFGASTLLVIESAAARETRPAATHYSRMFWLLLFGMAHFYLIWFGDILILYALCGILLYLFRNLSVKALVVWAIGFFTIALIFMLGSYLSFLALQMGVLEPQMAEGMKEGLKALSDEMGPNSTHVASDLAMYRGSYAGIFNYKITELLLFPLVSFLQFAWETMGLMLIGMALFKSRMLTGEWEKARYRKWALVCFAISVPFLTVLAIYQMRSGYDVVAVFGASLALSIPFDVTMTVGWAALVMLMIKSVINGNFVARLAATGRMAFSNYLGTSIIMTTLFYGYGFGLFGELGRAALWLVVIAMGVLMLLWSKPWLEHYRYGPLEWLWRSLARWELQPMLR